NKLQKKNLYQESVDRKLKKEQIDIEWDHLSNAIQEAANKHIPWSKVKKTEFSIDKISHSKRSRFNIQIKQINEKNKMEIPPLPSAWNLVNVDDL
ncbi:37080_t:CDS:2, partial [Gigaspora margarita]